VSELGQFFIGKASVSELGQFITFLVGLAALTQIGGMLARVGFRTVKNRRQTTRVLEDFRSRVQHAVNLVEEGDDSRRGAWQSVRKFIIARKVKEAADICSYYLTPYDGKPVPPFEPGQHLTFQLNIPDQPKPVIRCYSLSDAPDGGNQYRVTIRCQRAPRDETEIPDGLASSYFHDVLQEGDTVDLKAPNGRFCLDIQDTRPVVLIAGGIGVTPLISMLNAIVAGQKRRKVWLFYGMRSRAHFAFEEHLGKIENTYRDFTMHVRYSRPSKPDAGLRGRISIDLVKEKLPSRNCVFYICGTAAMMSDITQGLRDWGVPDSDIHFEAFGAPAPKTSPKRDADDQAGAEAGPAMAVTFAKSGKSAKWSADCNVLLDVAEANGVRLPSGCRAGQCGSCAVPVVEGKVRYVVEPGLAVADGHCLACVAVPETELVIDA
jgi:ferredoxin-NADP reductase